MTADDLGPVGPPDIAVTGLVGDVVRCHGCAREFKRTRPERRYCSRACADEAYNRARPVRRLLGPGPSSGHRREAIARRLEEGPATTWDLMVLGGPGWSSRLTELRRLGWPIARTRCASYWVYRLEGPRPIDPWRGHPADDPATPDRTAE